MRRSGDEGSPRDPVPVEPSRAAPIALFPVVALARTAAAASSHGARAADLRHQEEQRMLAPRHDVVARTPFGRAELAAAAARIASAPAHAAA